MFSSSMVDISSKDAYCFALVEGIGTTLRAWVSAYPPAPSAPYPLPRYIPRSENTQAAFSRQFASVRQRVTVLSDERVKLTNQAVTGARLMKINAWEPALEKQICRRETETTACIGHYRSARSMSVEGARRRADERSNY